VRRAAWLAVLPASALFALAMPSAVSAQRSGLERVEELARYGRTEEAREVLAAWWETERVDASRTVVQRGLWLRGRLTVDPVQAALDFQRLVIEYPGGPFTDRALFRLAQAAHAQGDADAASRHVAALIRDYPNSASRRDVERWLSEAGPAPPARNRPSPNAGEEQSKAPAADTVGAVDAAADDFEEPVDTRRYAVQLGAFADEDRARALSRKAEDAGLEVRLVRVGASRLLHVRVGRFDSSREATVLLREISQLGFTAAVVRDAHTEELVRR